MDKGCDGKLVANHGCSQSCGGDVVGDGHNGFDAREVAKAS
jgi:hypothetical protein